MKTFVIRLKDNDLSCSLAKDAIQSVNKFGIDPIVFDAIPASKSKQFLLANDLKLNSNFENLTLGTIGCFASHYSIWNKCVEQNEAFVILEHDGVMLRDPSFIVDEVDEICHLDRYLPFMSKFGEDSEQWSEEYNHLVNTTNVHGVEDHPVSTFYDNNIQYITNTCFRGCYGYLIKPIGAQKLIDFCNTYGVFPSDRVICDKVLKLQRSRSTYVRLNPFFKSIKIQRNFTTR